MSWTTVWLAAVFLPIFPLSMVFNAALDRVRSGPARALILLLWPQIGLLLVLFGGIAVPGWLPALAVFTSALYAFRALALREVGRWVSYLATSAWALIWVVLHDGTGVTRVHLDTLGFSIPLAMLALLGARLEHGFGTAYTGLYGGLAQLLPRFSAVFVFVVLAVIAVPLFPTFSAMLRVVVATSVSAPLAALAIAGVWLLWSWAGARLVQGLIVGPAIDCEAADLTRASTWSYAAVLIALVVGGIYVMGALP